MNYTQNNKIEQVKETTMIVGIDVGSEKDYFSAFNWRGIKLTRKPVPFSNSMEGFDCFYNTVMELMQKNKLEVGRKMKLDMKVLMEMRKILVNEECKLENVFLKIALIFGMFFALLMPIMQVQDEDTHTMRSVNMAKFNYFDYKEGFDIPYSIYKYIGYYTEQQGVYVFEENTEYRIDWEIFKEAIKIPLDDENCVFFQDGDGTILRTGFYGNLSYLPQGLGILIGRIFQLPIFWTLILGRLTKLIFYITLVYWAIKLAPIGKEVIFVVALLPNSIQYAASLSPDGVLTSCSLLFIAYILYLQNREDIVRRKDWIILVVLLCFIFHVKYIYTLQGLLVLTIPKEKISPDLEIPKLNRNQKIGIGLLCLIAIVIGYGVACQVPGALGECARNPINFILSILCTIRMRANFLALSLVANFGTGPVLLPSILSYGILLFALLSAFMQIGDLSDKNKTSNINIRDIIVYVVAILAIVIIIFMTGVLIGGGTLEAGPTMCSGLLGRYFIVPLCMLLILLRITGVRFRANYYLVNTFIICYLTYSCLFIVNRYWI